MCYFLLRKGHRKVIKWSQYVELKQAKFHTIILVKSVKIKVEILAPLKSGANLPLTSVGQGFLPQSLYFTECASPVKSMIEFICMHVFDDASYINNHMQKKQSWDPN